MNTGYYIIYLDSSKLFPTLDETINPLNFIKIHLKQPPQKVGV